MSDPLPLAEQRQLRPLAPRVAAGGRLNASRIMESVLEAAFVWDFETDTILWDHHAWTMLAVETAAEIATGAEYQLRIVLQTGDQRTAAMSVPTGALASMGPQGWPYCMQYSFHPRGRGHAGAMHLEEEGHWWPGPDGRPARAVGIIRVITARYEHEQRLRRRGEQDELTGQLNRASLIEGLDAAFARAKAAQRPCAFVLAAVNGLDVVNETFGLRAGDEVLAGVAKLIKRHLRHGDLLGRMGANKFGIVLNDCGPGTMRVVADRLMAAVRAVHFETTSAKLAATISIGGVSFPDRAASAEEGMAYALQALDRARRRRLDSFVAYEAGPEEENVRRRNTALANALISALDEQRMVLELQPMVCAATGKPEHYECLLRMINHDGSRVSAGDFMPIAEQLGLSRLIDLRTQQLAIGLLHRYPDLQVSLNVSGLTSGDNEWLVSLHKLTGGQRSITQRLTIEITETAAIHDLDQTMIFVDTIKDLGCKAAIDDFGVGYTNFRNLKLLNADLVKIDGAFVKNVCNDAGDQVFIKSMVELARAFGMQTVAEWVGDEATATFLTAAGIDYLQGFHYGAPAVPEFFLGPPVRI